MKHIPEIWIINGPNLNLLGAREPEIYGSETFEHYLMSLRDTFNGKADLLYFQSNHEGAIIDKLQEVGFDDIKGIVLNAAGYTHTSVAIRDCVSAIAAPVVEVHISNINEREEFRKVNFLQEVCADTIVGEGLPGYEKAVRKLLQ